VYLYTVLPLHLRSSTTPPQSAGVSHLLPLIVVEVEVDVLVVDVDVDTVVEVEVVEVDVVVEVVVEVVDVVVVVGSGTHPLTRLTAPLKCSMNLCDGSVRRNNSTPDITNMSTMMTASSLLTIEYYEKTRI
jgi:hypothetical protein